MTAQQMTRNPHVVVRAFLLCSKFNDNEKALGMLMIGYVLSDEIREAATKDMN